MTHHGEINLEQPRSIKVDIINGKHHISRGKLLLRAASAGLRLHTAEAVVQESELKIEDQSQPGTISLGGLAADATASVKVPYSIESDLRDIVVRMEMMYTTVQGDFTYAYNSKISNLLPLAINVQDVFKQNMLFSRFSIGTATSMPLRLFNCYLEGNSKYYADSPSLTNSDLDVFDLQPLSFISKIHKRPGSSSSSKTSETIQRRLYLQMDYGCWDDEIFASIEHLLSTALEGTSFLDFSRILKPTLSSSLRKSFSPQTLEASVLHRQVRLPKFAEVGWEIPLSGLPADQSRKLTEWLSIWHEVCIWWTIKP